MSFTILTLSTKIQSQIIPFSKHYNHNINSGTNEIFDLDGSYVIEKFYPTALHPFEGTIMFQPIRHNNAPGSVKLQVSLQDQNGVVVISRTFGLPLQWETETWYQYHLQAKVLSTLILAS
ncbi:MAG: hypothetical protein HWD58_12855 [Bacteroidota bacterium]|nr:MAG: hypothetical protein HWD58_12855 [Bacteroidota bacterium]